MNTENSLDEKNIQSPNACTYTFGTDHLFAEYKYALDLNFPVRTKMNNETELFIATKISPAAARVPTRGLNNNTMSRSHKHKLSAEGK